MNKTLKKLLVLTGIMLAFCMLLSVGILADGEDVVAKIGETPYTDLHEAITAVSEGGTVTVVSDITIPNTANYMNAGGTKAYTIEGSTGTEKITFPVAQKEGFDGIWGKTSITFKKLNVVVSGPLSVGDSVTLTFGKDSALKATNNGGGTIIDLALCLKNENAVVNFESGSAIKNIYAKKCIYLENGKLNIDGATVSGIVFAETFVESAGSSQVNVKENGVNISGWVNAGIFTGWFNIKGESGSFNGPVTVSSGDNILKIVATDDASKITLGETSGLKQIEENGKIFYPTDVVILSKTSGESVDTRHYHGITNALSAVTKLTEGYTMDIYSDIEIPTSTSRCELSRTF